MAGEKKSGEFAFIDRIKSAFQAPEGVLGIGDDCSVIPQDSAFETLVSTDMLVEGSHFLRDDISPYQLGWKSAAVNFSDIAAMGGEVTGSFLAIAIPKDLDAAWADEFLRGYKAISERYEIPLLGGDTTSSPDRISVCVTVMGRCPLGKSIKRSGAKAGDLICVTGSLGDSGLGLDAILRRRSQEGEDLPFAADILIERHYTPYPRINEGLVLVESDGVHAMMDISDGIASDLRHILEESHCDAQVDLDLLPISMEAFAYCKRMGLVPQKYALCSGEDYELLFTVDPSAEPELDVAHTVIGRILPYVNGSVEWKNVPESLDPETFKGFSHF